MIDDKKQNPHWCAVNMVSASWDSFGYYWFTVQVTAVVTSTHSADTIIDISKAASLHPSILPMQLQNLKTTVKYFSFQTFAVLWM
jgi:hypothetical protein